MKLQVLIIFFLPFSIFSQNHDSIPSDCWQEYQHDNLPFHETEYCPLILCAPNTTICYLVNDNEMYTDSEGWKRTSENKIEIGGTGWQFNIVQESNRELHLESIEYPGFKIYLRKNKY